MRDFVSGVVRQTVGRCVACFGVNELSLSRVFMMFYV